MNQVNTARAMLGDGLGNLEMRIEEENAQSNFLLANEYADFKEFLMDHYFDGGIEEFNECYDGFMRWQGYTEKEISESKKLSK
jgi:hypothetical protein